MSLPVTVSLISSSQTLESGFRMTANANFKKQITNVTITPDLVLRFTFQDGSFGDVNLGQYVFSKSQANGQAVPIANETLAGKVKLATATETLTGLNDTSAVTPYKLDQYFQYILSRDFVTSEALSAGDMVNVYDDNGTQKLRKAVSTDTSKFCCGYVREDAAVGDEVAMFVWGIVTGYSGLTPGMPYYLSSTVAGGIQAANPNSNFSQLIGFAIANDTLYFNASPARPIEEEPYEFIPITGTKDSQDNFIPTPKYNIGNLVNGREILTVESQQSDYGRKLLRRTKPNKPGQWSYNPDTGELTVDANQQPEGGELIIGMKSFGTAGFGYGTDLIVDEGLFKYKFGNQSDAEYKVAGAIPIGSSMTINIPISNYQAGDTYTSAAIDLTNKRLVSRTLYDEDGDPLEDVQVRFDKASKTFSFALGYDLTTATLTYRTEPI